MIRNTFKNTFPYVLHSPTDSEVLCKYMNFLRSSSKKYTKPSNLEIITFNSSTQSCLLEDCLNLLSLEYTVLRANNWNNTLKIPLTINFLENCEADYILSIDGYDAIVVKDLVDIVDQFKLQSKKMIFNATCYKWPSVPQQFKCDSIHNDNPFVYLNAGVWIGEKKYCLKLFKEALRQKSDLYPNSEQILIKMAAENFDFYDIDNKSIFFQVIQDGFMKNTTELMIKVL